MKWDKLQKNTKDLLIIDKNTLRNIESAKDTLDFNIKYWLKKDKLISLKKGLYIFRDKWEKERDKDSYLEYIANQLLQPSYLSLGYVLAKYQLLTEARTRLTSVTIKSGRSFNNKLAAFDYYSISEKLFIGYRIKWYKNTFINIATKEKALFDFLYFYFLNKRPNKKNIENLRINWENLTKDELINAQKFCKFINNKGINRVFEIIL